MVMEDDDNIARSSLITWSPLASISTVPTRPSNLVSDAEKDRPIFFIVDLRLPETDGFQLCQGVRQHPSLRDVPILILTASTAKDDQRRARKSGADTYITKPFKPSGLTTAVRALSERDSSEERAWRGDRLVCYATTKDNHRTTRYREPNDEEQGKYRDCSHGD